MKPSKEALCSVYQRTETRSYSALQDLLFLATFCNPCLYLLYLCKVERRYVHLLQQVVIKLSKTMIIGILIYFTAESP
jgi:hypothetical protein